MKERTPLFRVENLTKEYPMGDSVVYALRGVSFEVYQGEYVAIMGPSGSGKSTLMHIIGCLDRPTSGSYYLRNRDVRSLSDDELAELRNSEIGFVFQSFNLLPGMTLLENVELPLLYAGVSAAERRERARRMLRWWVLVSGSGIIPTKYREDKGSGWPLPGRWSMILPLSSPMSPRVISTPLPVRRLWPFLGS